MQILLLQKYTVDYLSALRPVIGAKEGYKPL